MQWCDVTFSSIEENLALDEALLVHAEDGGCEVLRCWEWHQPAVVMGAAGRVVDDVHVENCARVNVPILRRASGGGTVLLDHGCLNFSVILNLDSNRALQHIPSSYAYILHKLQSNFAERVPGIQLMGLSDLAWNGRKFSGNAQQRKRRHLLHHGTVLYNFAVEQVGAYLKTPDRQPDYRTNRSHNAFLVNLPIERTKIVDLIRQAWPIDREMTDTPIEIVHQLVAEKYLQDDWTFRR